MERVFSLQSQTLTTIPTSLSPLARHCLNLKASEKNQCLGFPISKKYPNARNLRFLDIRARTSGKIKAISEAVEANPKSVDAKEKDLVFVAGATGKVGSRTVRELLKLGFRVRAGVRRSQKAETLVESVMQMKFQNASQPVEKLEIVECNLEKRDRIRPALGNASIVICCIGASEKEISDITGPYRIDFQATKNLIDAATFAKADHFILVTSLGTNKFGFPAAILNLFWGVLCWKRKAEEALLASGLPYTIVRPGGMERPTDAYKETHNITLSVEDTLFGGQVSNLQVAELIACMAKNPKVSYCKVVEVIAETTAPLLPMEKLLEQIPSKHPYISSSTEEVVAADPKPASSTTIIDETKTTPDDPPAKENPHEAKPLSQNKPGEAKPLSPYAAYEDLKPPTSPSPTTSTSSVAGIASDANAKPVLELAASQEILEKSTEKEEETTQVDKKKTRPLPPYASYEDLKPPTTPTPLPSASKSHVNAADTLSDPNASVTETTTKMRTSVNETDPTPKSARPLSPYAVYEDLKPPASPSPTATVPRKDVRQISGGNNVPKTTIADDTSSNAPDNAYGDLKSTASELSGNDKAQPSLLGEASDAGNQASSKLRPLSPYAMYEDMKPPTSPIPSPSTSH